MFVPGPQDLDRAPEDDPFGVNNQSATHPRNSVGASALDGDGFADGAGAEFFYSSEDDGNDDDEEDDGGGGGDFHVAGIEQDLDDEEVPEFDPMGAGVIEADRMSNVDVADLMDMKDNEDDDELLEEDDAATRRIRQMEEILRFNDFNSLPLRYKLAGMIEPPVLGDTEISPKFLIFGRIYAVTISTFALLHVLAVCILSVEAVESYGLLAFIATTVVSVIDLVMRIVTIAPRSSKLGIVIDLLIIIASAMVIVDIYREWAVLLAILRGLRFMRVTILFEAFETMRDIYLVHRTIVASLQSLIVFVIVFMIGLFIFATGVWVLEQEKFDARLEIWLRPCTQFADCTTEPSPFQSIPDAMWLIGSAMTTVGLGDVVPSTTSARVITGLAIIAGVFVVAFPTMILVGNLTAVRRAYFRDEERRTARLQVMAVTTLASQQEEAGFAGDAKRASAFQSAVLQSFKTTQGSTNNLQHINTITGVLNRTNSRMPSSRRQSRQPSVSRSPATSNQPPQSQQQQLPSFKSPGANSTSRPLFSPNSGVFSNGGGSGAFGKNVTSGVFAASMNGPSIENAEALEGDEGMYCGILLDSHVSHLPKKASFDFMGGAQGKARDVILSQTGQYQYVPINRILLDCERNNYGVKNMDFQENPLSEVESGVQGEGDGAPLISHYTVLDEDLAIVTLHLVVDDEVSRSAAADALLTKGAQLTSRPITRSLAIHGLEVAVVGKAPEGITLLRRSDVGEVMDDHIPLVFSVQNPSQFGEELPDQIRNLQDALKGVQLRVMYRIHPKASSFWRCTHYIDKELLAETLFIRELWAIAANVNASLFMTPAQIATASDEILNSKRNVAYIPKMYIPYLLDELLERLSDPVYAGTSNIQEGKSEACISNRRHIETEVAEMIAYHCREVFFDELPKILRVAVFGRHLVDPEDTLLEVDVDFFKHAEWPIGSVVVEYSPTESLIERIVTIGEIDIPSLLPEESLDSQNPLLAMSPLRSGVFKGASSRIYTSSSVSSVGSNRLQSLASMKGRPLVKAQTASSSSKRIMAFTNESNMENSLRGSSAVEHEFEGAARLRRNKAITDEIAGIVGNTNELYIPPELLDNPNGFDMPFGATNEEDEDDLLFGGEEPPPQQGAEEVSVNSNGQQPPSSTTAKPLAPSAIIQAPPGTKEPKRAMRSKLREEDFDDDYYNDILTRGKRNPRLNAVATRKKTTIDDIDYDKPIVKASTAKDTWGKLKIANKFANLSSQQGRFTGVGKIPTQGR